MTDATKYRSVKLTQQAYDALVALQNDVYAEGLNGFPTELRPQDGGAPITLSTIVEVAVRAAQKTFQRRK